MNFENFAYTVRDRERRIDAVVELDGQWFQHCTFSNCTLVFKGIHPFGYAHSNFAGCTMVFEGAALMVLDRVTAMLPGIFDSDDLKSVLLSLAAGKVTLN